MSIRSYWAARPEWLPLAALLAVLLGYMACQVHYARAWDSRLELSLRAVTIAPEKPRVLNELALSLMEQRRFAEATIVLDEMARVSDDPQMPIWDRAEATQAVTANRLLLARFTDAARLQRR